MSSIFYMLTEIPIGNLNLFEATLSYHRFDLFPEIIQAVH